MFLRSRMIQNETLTAGAATRTDDLPVNPLSALLITLLGQNDAINVQASWANIMADIARLEVLYKGQSIISASLADLAALYYHLTGRFPYLGRSSAEADEANWFVTVPILFGPRPFDKGWCFPAVRRGELQMQITPGAAFTDQNDVQLQVETIELLDGAPTRFLKYTTMSKTPTATGDHDVDLPLGNPIRGVQLFGTTVPVDGAVTTSIDQLRMLVDNVEHGYAFANWESLRGESALYRNQPWVSAELVARLTGGAPAANDDTRALESPTSFLRNYAFLEYAPFGQDDYRLMTEGKGRVHLRITAGDTQAIRVIPVEEIAVQGSAAA
jgi:hypothetical protein